ncbi:Vacuolar protein-sorting-associated protein 36 [Savitreella phatthalungensis]
MITSINNDTRGSQRWITVDISSAKRPVLSKHESISFVQGNVGLYGSNQKLPDCQDGTVYLTNERIIYVDNQRPSTRSMSLSLAEIAKVEYSPGFLKSSPKITISYLGSDQRPAETSVQTPVSPLPVASQGDWLCPICTFTNVLRPDYKTGDVLSPCTNCGMKASKTVKINFHNEAQPPSLPERRSLDIKPANQDLRVLEGGAFPCPRCTFGNHPAVTSCELCGAPLVSQNLPPQLIGLIDDRKLSIIAADSLDDGTRCKISFRAHGSHTFLEKLRLAIAERAWVKHAEQDTEVLLKHRSSTDHDRGPVSPRTGTAAPMSSKAAGIGALQFRQRVTVEADATVMSDAFTDLQALMNRASAMVALAESFSKRLAAAPQTALTEDARQLVADSSAYLGLKSPVVTKDLAGREDVYHRELARQIAEFLESGALKRVGGVITLADLFALYNRARKGSLISPEDLQAACAQFDPIRLPVVTRTFRSGIVVVQDRSRTDASTRTLILNWLRDKSSLSWRGDGVSPTDAAQRFAWSVAVAREELDMCEAAGDLCRDTSIQGDRYYENLFGKPEMATWASIE